MLIFYYTYEIWMIADAIYVFYPTTENSHSGGRINIVSLLSSSQPTGRFRPTMLFKMYAVTGHSKNY